MKSHRRTSPGAIILYGKPPPPPGRNPMAELSHGEIIPYGKSPPTQIPYALLGQHVRFFFRGGGGGEKSHRWGTFTIWYLIWGKEIHGGRKSHVTPACKTAEESDAGLSGLSTSDTEVLGNLPKDQPGLGETTYET